MNLQGSSNMKLAHQCGPLRKYIFSFKIEQMDGKGLGTVLFHHSDFYFTVYSFKTYRFYCVQQSTGEAVR
jgi:hypothetical protein